LVIPGSAEMRPVTTSASMSVMTTWAAAAA